MHTYVCMDHYLRDDLAQACMLQVVFLGAFKCVHVHDQLCKEKGSLFQIVQPRSLIDKDWYVNYYGQSYCYDKDFWLKAVVSSVPSDCNLCLPILVGLESIMSIITNLNEGSSSLAHLHICIYFPEFVFDGETQAWHAPCPCEAVVWCEEQGSFLDPETSDCQIRARRLEESQSLLQDKCSSCAVYLAAWSGDAKRGNTCTICTLSYTRPRQIWSLGYENSYSWFGFAILAYCFVFLFLPTWLSAYGRWLVWLEERLQEKKCRGQSHRWLASRR